MVIMIDLDGVICTEEKTFERPLAKPIPDTAEALHLLRGQGHTVIIYTARSWAEYSMTVDWLHRHGIEYDALTMGKPIYDVWVDDRAIRFETWASLLRQIEMLQPHRTHEPPLYPADEYFVRENRRVIFEFLHWLADQDLPEPILEVGPMVDGRKDPKSVFSRYPEFYVDTRALFHSRGKTYSSLDIDPGVHPDYVGEISRIDEIMKPESTGTIIMLSVLEHVPEIWGVPRQVHSILKPGSWLCLQTPWNLRFHDPSPDCWRISDDGYHALFDQYFEFVSLDKVQTPGRDLMPICITAMLKKKVMVTDKGNGK